MAADALSAHGAGQRIPRATYRLQLHPQMDADSSLGRFDFDDARRAVRYLAALGIDTLYLSPPWQAAPQSMHGYDVTDHTQVSTDLGGERGLIRLSEAAREAGLGLLTDFVPNHMGIASGYNPYWEDVLRYGQASEYAHFFDITWQPSQPSLRGKVLLPVLGDQYGRVLERGELSVEYGGGAFGLRYFERLLPLSPRSTALILRSALPLVLAEHVPELRSLVWQAEHLPPEHPAAQLSDSGPTLSGEVRRLEERTAHFAALPGVEAALQAACEGFSAPEAMNELLRLQHYRLSYWRVASEQINYRRFFDVNDLAALRMEDERVFDWAHAKLFDLIARGVITGVRLDHTDGLHDPAGYFERLQARAAAHLPARTEVSQMETVHGAPAGQSGPLYVVAEKILETGEPLPDWPLNGTTGYDFLAQVSALCVDPAHEGAFTQLYQSLTGQEEPYASYAEVLRGSKQLVQRGLFAGEMQMLSEWLLQLASGDLRWQDLTFGDLHQALREVVACFPVYRSYLRPDGKHSESDEGYIRHALAQARQQAAELDPLVFDFLEEVLLPDPHSSVSQRHEYIQFVLKFQQLTGPIMAKGAEDTAFYRYTRLLSLNEVGGDPAQFGLNVPQFHALQRERLRWPGTLNALSTHDTKRGEDTRLRISVLSEMPGEWGAAAREWADISRNITHSGPHPKDLYTLFQTVLGIWPLQLGPVSAPQRQELTARLQTYMLKAVREGKERSNWLRPNEAYEVQLNEHIAALLQDTDFVSGVEAMHARISPYGAQNSLSASLLRLTAPGVPDIYQGSEVWHQTLVDPDNRRPVDYQALEQQLERIVRGAADRLPYAQKVLASYESGEIKQFVLWATLQARAQYVGALVGDYIPLSAGEYAAAFERVGQQDRLITVAPRLSYSLTRGEQPWALGEVWGERTLPLAAGRYRNLYTGERFTVREAGAALASVLEHFPLALLIREA